MNFDAKAKLVRFARKPLRQKWRAIKATFRRMTPGKRAAEEEISPAVYAPSSSSPPRLALVGCGEFAVSVHLPALRKLEKAGLVELVALCSRSQESLARASETYQAQGLKKYTSLESVLGDPEIDIVDLVLPIPAVPEAVRASLRAGKHVISEKPCAPTVAQCLDLLSDYALLERRPLWAVAENWRFKNTTLLAEQLIKNSHIGLPETVNFSLITYVGPRNFGWREPPDYPGGHILDWGVHFIALLRRIAGEIDSVSAVVSQRRAHLPPADGVTSVISFARGAEGSFQLSFAAPETGPSVAALTVIGSEGSLEVDFHRNRILLRNSQGERQIDVDDSFNGGVERLLTDCLGVIRHGSPLHSSPSEALRDLAVIEAMIESSRSGRPISPSSLYPALHGSGPQIAIYNGIQIFTPKHIVDCGSVAEVSSAVREAVSAGLRIRPIGVAHSWAPELVTRDVSLRLSQLNRILRVDTKQNTVNVEAGVRLGDLTRALAQRGLALPSLAYITVATIGGAVSTGTHGTSPNWGTLSDSVRSMKMVLASGELRQFGPASPIEELRAARLAVGMLGVIVELELEVVPMPWVRMVELNMDLGQFLAERPAIFARYEHVWGHWRLGADKVRVECFETSAKPAQGFRRYVVGDGAGWNPDGGKPGCGTGQIDVSMQYSVPLSEIDSAVERIRSTQFAALHSGQIVEMKFLKGNSHSFLGPNAECDSVSFNLAWSVDVDVKDEVFAPFEHLMRELHGRPHWGKFHQLPDLDYMKRAFPLWNQFEAVRSRLDPGGTFSIFPAQHL
ncbi:FAD-binding protein [Methylocapsa sp. D3K7]|uniref:FAD-binding protein n=1 Tax=Methylocapsa sp. D3K7 TaxID=3041435 RepID=UPI00244E6DA7|nr:FAD-binding protein [Methylocapsa sp. D3K7]WGJ14321.1 FAD-binding protein [Methylocapsa sp. D3K7]